MHDVSSNEARLCRLHGVHDGSLPTGTASVVRLKFAVDSSIEGDGVAELLVAIEATCRNSQALPFMGERAPQSWLQVGDALQKQQHARDGIGNCVLPVAEAAMKVRCVLQTELGIEVGLARRLDEGCVRSSLEFWSLQGGLFVHDGHFLRDPACSSTTDSSCDEFLSLLQKDVVLDHVMATVLALQPKRIELSPMCLPPVSAAYKSSFQAVISHEIVISSDDDGSFAFAARCVDVMMGSGRFGWPACRSCAADDSRAPPKEDWVKLNCSEDPRNLSEVLSANSSNR